MNPFRRIVDFFRRKSGMIGTPPSQRPMWDDPAAHARDFAERYAEPFDQGWRASAQALIHSRRRSQPSRVKRNTDSGPPTHVETGYMIRATTSSR